MKMDYKKEGDKYHKKIENLLKKLLPEKIKSEFSKKRTRYYFNTGFI